jgi:GAF domain-containing protein
MSPESQPIDLVSPSKTLLNCTCALRDLLVGLENQICDRGEPAELPSPGDRSSSTTEWEKNLAEAAVRHIAEAFHPQWAFVHWLEPVGGGFRTGTGIGLEGDEGEGGVADRVGELGRAFAAAGPIRIGDLQSDPQRAELARALPRTGLLWSAPLKGHDGKVQGALALGFEKGRSEPSAAEMNVLDEAAKYIGASLSGHRRIVRYLAAAAGSDQIGAGGTWQPLTARTTGVFPALSLAISTCSSETRGLSDYYAAVSAPSGDLRLFIARLAGQGSEMAWETLAFDVAFRAACVLCGCPAEIVEMVSDAWGGATGEVGSVRHICCADVAESGRGYVFAGSASHLLYASRGQTIVEIYERLPEESQGHGVWDGQHIRLHSGDVVILHTCDLPAALPSRHDLFRRLSAILAREGRRPVETIAGQVMALFCNGSLGSAPAPVLALLRAE